VIKDKWGPEYKHFSHENGRKFSKKLGIFPEWLFLKNGIQFLRGFLMQRFVEINPEFRPSAPPNPLLIK